MRPVTSLVGAAIALLGSLVLFNCGSDSSGDIPSGTDAGPTDDASTNAFGDGSPGDDGGDAAASGDAGPPTNAFGCSGTQQLCSGKCVATSVDPNNCGACGTQCTGGKVCFSSACVASCPAGFTPCNGSCVDTAIDNANCGGCGAPCGAGKGCVGGTCVNAVAVGPAPSKCAGGGPPIVIQGISTPTCSGAIAAVSFTHALCACTTADFRSDTFIDAFDSKAGPYAPNGLGGSVGADGKVSTKSQCDVYGDIRSSGAASLDINGQTTAHLEVQAQGTVALGSQLNVTKDAYVGGAISGGGQMSVGGKIHVPTCPAPAQVNATGACQPGAINVTEPCACKSADIVPVQQIVTYYSNAANNDNASINLQSNVFDAPGGATRLDLPCGYYYLDRIAAPATIVVHGPTALFIGGSVDVGTATFTLDPGATLDVFVAGTVHATGQFDVGTTASPSASRFYVGGVCKDATASCTVNGDCCSHSCVANKCVGANEIAPDPAWSVLFTSNIKLNGLYYAANASIASTSDLEMYGAIFTHDFANTSNTRIHYDRAATTLSDECPKPGTTGSAGGVAADGGIAPTPCGSCRDCNNQACINGMCGACQTSSDCCSPLVCVSGQCVPPPIR